MGVRSAVAHRWRACEAGAVIVDVAGELVKRGQLVSGDLLDRRVGHGSRINLLQRAGELGDLLAAPAGYPAGPARRLRPHRASSHRLVG